MNLSDDKAIKTSQWFPNEILRDDDINFVGEATYQNITDQIALRATQSSVDEVVSGLVLSPDTLMTLSLSAGAAVSFSGSYLTGGTWGFTAGSGDIFSVINPVDEEVAISTADPTNPRIDVVEIRPIEIPYDSKARQFKDPVTGLVSTATVNVKKEYGIEVQVLEGTAGASPSAPSKTDGWIKLAEVYVEANATTIHDFDIITYVGTGLWDVNAGTIVGPELTSDVQIIMNYEYDTSDKWQRMLYTVPLNLQGHTVEIYVNGSVTLPAGSLYFPAWTNGNVVFKGITSAELHATALSTGLNIIMAFDSVDVQFNSIEFYDVCFSVQDVNSPGGSSSFNAITCLFDWPDAEGTGTYGYGFFLQGFSAGDWYNCDFEHGTELTANITCFMSYCSVVNSLPVTVDCLTTWVYRLQYVTIMDTTNLNSGDLYEPSSDYYTLLDVLDGYVNNGAYTGSSVDVTGEVEAGSLNITAGDSTIPPVSDVSSGVTKVLVETGNDNKVRHGDADSIVDFTWKLHYVTDGAYETRAELYSAVSDWIPTVDDALMVHGTVMGDIFTASVTGSAVYMIRISSLIIELHSISLTGAHVTTELAAANTGSPRRKYELYTNDIPRA